jgi:hypothetical protein
MIGRIILAAGLFVAGTVTAQAAVLEDFETGAFAPAWTFVGGTPTVSGAGAFEGAFGVADGGGAWAYRTDAAANLGVGSHLSAWTRGGGGRFYLGFDADAGGASSFVVAWNTGDIRFQNNPGYGFNELNVLPVSLSTDKWYRAEVVFGAGAITGNLYDSDGVTLLHSLVASGLTGGASGGVAVRGFGGVQYDLISTSVVPEPATWAMLIAGFGLVGSAMRRRRAVAIAA